MILIENIASKKLVYKKVCANIFSKLFIYVVLISLAYLLLYPLFYMIVTVFRSAEDLNNPAVVWITRTYTLDNIKKAVEQLDFGNSFPFSLSLALPCAIFQTIACALAGYGFARFNFKGKSILFAVLILTIIVPEQTILIPLYGMIQSLGLLNSVVAFWVQAILGMGLKSGLFIFIFCQFYKGLPKELESAAMLDGCNSFGIFVKIILPNVIPAIITVFFFSFVWHWNENYLTKFVLNQERTLSYLVSNATTLISNTGSNVKIAQAIIQSCSLILLLPTLILFFILQRHLREGIARSGIVG